MAGVHEQTEVRRGGDGQGHPPPLGRVAQQGEDDLEHGGERHRADVRLAGLEGVERRADDPCHVVDLGEGAGEVLPVRAVARERLEDELGPPRDHVQRGSDLVRDAGAELAGGGEGLRAMELPREVKRPLRLGDELLPGGEEPRRHRVEGPGDPPQLVASRHRHGDVELPLGDALDALHQAGDRTEHRPLEGEADRDQQDQEEERRGQGGAVVGAEERRVEAGRDVRDLEGARHRLSLRAQGEDLGVEARPAPPPVDGVGLAGVHDEAESPLGRDRRGRQDIGGGARPEARVDQADLGDLGLLDDQLGEELRDVGGRVVAEGVLHRQPDGPAGDLGMAGEVLPAGRPVLFDLQVGEDAEDRDQREQDGEGEAQSQTHDASGRGRAGARPSVSVCGQLAARHRLLDGGRFLRRARGQEAAVARQRHELEPLGDHPESVGRRRDGACTPPGSSSGPRPPASPSGRASACSRGRGTGRPARRRSRRRPASTGSHRASRGPPRSRSSASRRGCRWRAGRSRRPRRSRPAPARSSDSPAGDTCMRGRAPRPGPGC